MADDEILDARRIAELGALGGADEPELLSTLVDAFLAGARAATARLAEATEAGDARAVADCAHDLRGSSGNMGAVALHALCAHVERAARGGHVDPGAPASVLAALGRAEAALREYLGRGR